MLQKPLTPLETYMPLTPLRAYMVSQLSHQSYIVWGTHGLATSRVDRPSVSKRIHPFHPFHVTPVTTPTKGGYHVKV
jgi:hypothetical protein